MAAKRDPFEKEQAEGARDIVERELERTSGGKQQNEAGENKKNPAGKKDA